MSGFASVVAPLVWLGRRGPWPLGVSLAAGFALPFWAEPLRVLLAPFVLLLLAIAFARIPSSDLTAQFRRPGRQAVGVVWMLVALPLAAALLLRSAGLAPELAAIIVAGLASSPVISTPAYALMLGLPGAVSLALLTASLVCLPVTLPLVLRLGLGPEAFAASPVELALRLACLLAGAALLAFAARRLAGPARIARAAPALDGVSHVLLFVLAIILVGPLTPELIARPGLVFALFALSALVSMLAFAATAFAARLMPGLSAGERGAAALSAGVRNLALVLAVMPETSPLAALYVGAAQVPIYLAPLALARLDRSRGADPS